MRARLDGLGWCRCYDPVAEPAAVGVVADAVVVACGGCFLDFVSVREAEGDGGVGAGAVGEVEGVGYGGVGG